MSDILLQLNGLLVAIVLIVAFSLCAYIFLHNWRNGTARALCMLLLSVVIVAGGDVLLGRAVRPETIQFLLRAQWLGIALVPAAYVHMAYALAANNQINNSLRHWVVILGYIGSGIFFLLALYTELIVSGGIPDSVVRQFQAGPLLWVYTGFLLGSMVWLFRTILQVRRQTLMPALRRRMTYLAATFAAPGFSLFPYLAIANTYTAVPRTVTLIVAALVSAGLVVAQVVLAYSLAFQGARLPDRLIKYDFTRWWLYGPVVGVTIILCLQTVPWLERVLGLPADTLITFAVMIMTVLMPLFISQVRPYLDALVHREDQAEIEYLRSLPRNTFTQADLRQLLENTLIAVCGALQVETGFVATPGREGYRVRALCGSRQAVKQFVADNPLDEVLPQLEVEQAVLPNHRNHLLSQAFQDCDGFRLMPLCSPDGVFLGALGVMRLPEAPSTNGALTSEAHYLITVLAHQIELALTTVDMQQRIFTVLRGMGPEMQSLQQLSTRLEQATSTNLPTLEPTDLAEREDFAQMVKDALTHYWGGPKLSDSPLLDLQTVRSALTDHGGNPTRALQTVLRQAITNLRPDEQLDPSAQEWLLYNILELRFLQGKRIRDVSSSLAMSESDYYRKQRIAVEQVAQQIAMMENGQMLKETQQPDEGERIDVVDQR